MTRIKIEQLMIWVLLAAACLLFYAPGNAVAADALAARDCGTCHRIEPANETAATNQTWELRAAPDLFYAGSKYRKDWLTSWLQAPTRIRPAGLHPDQHIQQVDGKDQLDTTTLAPHPVVAAADVDAIVAALMSKTWGQERLPESANLTVVPRMLAQMNFVKFKGCGSCHRTTQSYGGLSGPELYTAWQRMTPEFLQSYIADPQAWDPVAPMPGFQLAEGEVGKLLEYLRLIGAEK